MTDSKQSGSTPDGQATDPDAVGALAGTVVRGAGIAAVGHGGAQGLTLIAYIVLARLLSPSDFGEFAAASILLSAGSLLAESGMLSAVIHRRDRVDEAASTAVIATVSGGFALGLIAAASAPLLGLYFDSSTITAMAAAISGILVLRSIPVVPDALLQRRFSIVRRVVTEPVGVIAFGVSATIAAVNDLGPWALVIGYYALASTEAIITWAVVRWKPRLDQVSYGMWRELVSYGRHVLGGTAILRLGELVPVFLLGRFTGTAALGQYRYAARISAAPFGAILATGSWLLFPAFARISHQAERFRASFLRALHATSALGMPAGLILIPLGVPIAVLVFGPVWRDAGEASAALCLLTGAASLTSVSTEAFKGVGRPELLVRTHSFSVVVGATAMIALLPYGLTGVAAGVSIGAVAGALYSVTKTRSVIGTTGRELVAEIWPSAIAAVLMAGVVWSAENRIDAESHGTGLGLLLLTAELLLAAAVYLSVLLSISPRARDEAGLLLAAGRGRWGRKGAVAGGEAGEQGGGSEPLPPPATPHSVVAPASRRRISGAAAGDDYKPLTTVVIPAYNAERTIEATLRSVLAQTEPRLRVVVVDDGSSDRTPEIVDALAGDERLKLIRQENQGVAAARNTGIALARTPYVSFLDNDDLWMPRHLEGMMASLEANPAAGFANADGWVLDDVTGRVRRAPFSAQAAVPDPLPGDPRELLLELAKNNFVWGSVTVRKTVLDRLGGFRSVTNGSDDYDLWLRIAADGHLLERPEGRLIVQRIRPDSQGQDFTMMIPQGRTVLALLANNPDVDEGVRAVALGRLPHMDRKLAFESAGGPRGFLRLTRRSLGRLRRKALYNRKFHRTLPPELQQAFGDRLKSSRG